MECERISSLLETAPTLKLQQAIDIKAVAPLKLTIHCKFHVC